MGAAPARCLEALCGGSLPVSIDWTPLACPSLHTFLLSDQVAKHPVVLALSASVCQHTMQTRVLWICSARVLNADLQLAANLLLMLRAFFAVLFSERIPYHFVYMSSDTVGEPTSQRRCLLHYQNSQRELDLSIPVSGDRACLGRLMQEVIRGFDQVKEEVRTGRESLVFFDDQGKPLTAEEIAAVLERDNPQLWVSTSACEQ